MPDLSKHHQRAWLTCARCGKEFYSRIWPHLKYRYCGNACRQAAKYSRIKEIRAAGKNQV